MLEGGGGTVEDFSKAKEESHRLEKFCIGVTSRDFGLLQEKKAFAMTRLDEGRQ